jgi:hypothetical protein
MSIVTRTVDLLSDRGKGLAQSSSVVICLLCASLDSSEDHMEVSSLLLGESGVSMETAVQTSSEKFYLSQNRTLKSLAILCQGLVDADGDPVLFSFN